MPDKNYLQELQKSLEQIPSGICVYRRVADKFELAAQNDQAKELLGSEPLPYEIEESLTLLWKGKKPLDSCQTTEGLILRITGRLTEYPDGERLVFLALTDITAIVRSSDEPDRQALTSIIRYAPGGVFVYSAEADEEFSFVSDNMLKMLGYTESEFRKKFKNKFSKMIYEEDREATIRSIWEQIAIGPYDSCVYRIPKKDGSLIRVQDEGHIITDGCGKRWFYVVIVDITNLERTREDNFNLLIQGLLVTNPNALCTFRLNLTQNRCTDGHGTSAYIRQLVAESDTADGLLKKLAGIFTNQDEAKRFLNDFSRDRLLTEFAAGNDHLEITYRRQMASGESHWVTTYFKIMQNPYTGDIEAIAYSVDSDHAHKESLIISLITSVEYECIGLVDTATRRLSYYYAAGPQNKQNYPERFEERVEQTLAMIGNQKEEQEFLSAIAFDKILTVLKDKPNYTIIYPCRNHRKQITLRYLDADHQEIMFTQTDVTESLNQEEQQTQQLRTALLAAEQASIAKTEFLSRMSHEIRTPMNAIIGLDAIALQEKGLTKSVEDHLQKIGISARFLLSLINDILDMSRIESGKMVLRNEPFNFEEFIAGINTIMYEQCRTSEQDYECVLKSFTEESYVGDKTKLQQILINILGNSVKFTPRGGKVHLMVEQVSRTKTKARLRFEISDTGIGMEPDFLPHLFEAFTQENRGRTSRYGGTGLGLAISKNLVSLMNGDITVHSIKGIGSEFTAEIELGLTESSLRRDNSALIGHLVPLNTLIVDDDVIVCQHTQILLSQAGLKAEWAESGEEAVEKVTAGRKADSDYDLILLDWKMPDMDGIETAKAIRKIVGPEVTIIIMTAYDWADIEDKAKAAGVDMFMKKPIFVSSVTKAFENVFLKKSGSPDPDAKPKFDFTGKRILLAEDNEINAEIAKNILEMRNCTVDLASNGVEAIEAFSSTPVSYYDVIFMDVRMPVMDGLEATRAIRAMKKSDSRTIPIIAMTANAFQEDIDATRASGMNAHLAKPIEPELLYETMDRYLKKAGH